jgi:hypothetical protein
LEKIEAVPPKYIAANSLVHPSILIGDKSPVIKPAKDLAGKQETAGLFTALKNGPIVDTGLALSLNFDHKIDLIPS